MSLASRVRPSDRQRLNHKDVWFFVGVFFVLMNFSGWKLEEGGYSADASKKKFFFSKHLSAWSCTPCGS